MLGTVLLLLLALAGTACPSPASGASRREEALKKLLEVFGMEDPPAPPTHFKQPPQYMVDLFNTVANADGVTKNPDILEGNTVRSFLDKSKGGRGGCGAGTRLWGGAGRGWWRCRPWFCSSKRVLLSSSQRGDAVPVCPLQPCKRHPLSVDFEEIGWSGWIISPRGYNAFHCKGSCPFPLGENMRPTNHATVQSIINALKLSEGVSSPCCVPDKLHSINLLYFDDDENVVLKQYDDMVAGSCGCH
ncbi:UNIV protein, partial [Erythrocercus mccallii]|nr:UNIV protein [Erythrocercus mccallii]